MSACPHCGCTSFTRTYQCRGNWVESVSLNNGVLEVMESTTDALVTGKEPKTMTCDECRKRVLNPDYK